jgi:glyoxylase-like metal-dependent hydrolase (beta-lactamase superfamily II)
VITVLIIHALQKKEKETGKKIKGIVISHPHFYTTSLSWAAALKTKVMFSREDLEWFQVDIFLLNNDNFSTHTKLFIRDLTVSSPQVIFNL